MTVPALCNRDSVGRDVSTIDDIITSHVFPDVKIAFINSGFSSDDE